MDPSPDQPTNRSASADGGSRHDDGRSADGGPSRAARVARTVREHPVTVGVFVVGVISGIILAFVLPFAPEDMPAWKRVLGGAILGGWLALFPLGFRLFD